MIPAPKTLDADLSSARHSVGIGALLELAVRRSRRARALLGVYALLAEWNALMDPATEASASRIKLAWWQEEIQRLIARAPVHPICRYLAALPRGRRGRFLRPEPGHRRFDRGVERRAAGAQRGTRTPCLRAARRPAGVGVPARLRCGSSMRSAWETVFRALAAADYLARVTRDYRRQARQGRVPFAVEELLAAGVDNADLCADQPSAKLEDYLRQLRARAAQNYETAALALPGACRREPASLAGPGGARPETFAAPHSSGLESARLQDMLLAWSTARRALKVV